MQKLWKSKMNIVSIFLPLFLIYLLFTINVFYINSFF